jgi:hypothetical protein
MKYKFKLYIYIYIYIYIITPSTTDIRKYYFVIPIILVTVVTVVVFISTTQPVLQYIVQLAKYSTVLVNA